MKIEDDVIQVVCSVLNISRQSRQIDRDTPLLGSVAELDSMAVVSVLTRLEERFGIVVEDDEIDGRTFATMGSLADFVGSKLGQ